MESSLVLLAGIVVLVVLYVVISVPMLWSKRSADQQRIDELLQRLERLDSRLESLEKTPRQTQATSQPQQASPTPAPAPITYVEHVPIQSPDQVPVVRAEIPATPPPAPEPPIRIEEPVVAHHTPPPPPPPAPFINREPAPEPQPYIPPPPPKPSLSLEERFGTNWLNKLGIIIVVIGIASFLATKLPTLSPVGKVLVGMGVCAFLLIGGIFLERRQNYRIFARAGIGGGWALTYFLTYAMYHYPATQVLQSQTTDLVLMMLVATGMVWHSLRYKSQTVTALAFVLAFLTVGISPITVFTLISGLLLAAGLIFVTFREHWYELELLGLIGLYLNHLLWLLKELPDGGVPNHPFAHFTASAALILVYWLLFRLSYVLRKPNTSREETLSAFTAIFNSAGMLGLLKYQSAHPEWAFRALLALGVAEMLFALYARPRRRTAFIVLSSISSVFLLAAIPFHFGGAHWSVLWLLEAEVLFLTGLRMREPVFRWLGHIASLAAAVQITLTGVFAIFQLRSTQPDTSHHIATTITLTCAALIFWFNAEAAPRLWPGTLDTDTETSTLQVTSVFGMLAAVAALWVVLPGSLTVVVWMLLSLAIGLIADRLTSKDLPFQADAIAVMALLRIAIINLFDTAHWGSLSQRSVTVALCAALYYLCARRKSGTPLLHKQYIPAAYTWAGSTLLGLLVWYELRPISIAVAWGVLGLILFEIGLLTRRNYLRHQGYALLAASFVRIWFANLNVPGEHGTLSPSLYTILPLVAAYFWVYERLQSDTDSESKSTFDVSIAALAAWLGTIATVAITYFEAAPNWVAVTWAALVFVLAATAWLLKRRIFLAQALTLLIGVLARAAFFNLTAAPLNTGDFWTTRLVTTGCTCLVLLFTLPIAFRLRDKDSTTTSVLNKILNRPEQPLFFVPLALLTVLLAVELRAGLTTISWSALGVLVFLTALPIRERSYRLAGLGLLLLGVGKILVIDIWHLNATDRYLTLIIMGVALLLVSFLYTRYREFILKYL